MQYSFNAAGLGECICRELRIASTLIAGQVVMDDVTSQLGCIITVAATAAANQVGVTLEGGTYSASTPVDVLTNISPFAVYKGAVNLGTANGTALTVLTNTASSQVLFSSASIPNKDLSGGTLFALSGANRGRWVTIDNFSNGVSYTLTNGFPVAIAVGDTAVAVTHGFGDELVRLTATLDQVDGYTDVATGIDAKVVDVTCDYHPTAPQVYVYFTLGDHFLNPNA